jgi:large subunit ribosomal protein L18Ae
LNGQIIACNEIFEADTTTVKNFGIWIRYQSRTGYHNSYKEYRETTMNAAVDALYEEMASRHRVRASCLQIIKIAEVADKDVRRENTRQFIQDDLSFPVVTKVTRHPSKASKTIIKYKRPNHVTL